MSQHDFDVANGSGATVRSDLNSALVALASGSSGATAPATTYAYQIWHDTTLGIIKQRNAANNAWIIRGTLAETRTFSRSSNTILGVADYGCLIYATSTFTQTLTAAATLADGWWCNYVNAGTGTITLDPNGAETINGATTLDLTPGQGVIIVCNGTSFRCVGPHASLNGAQTFTAAQRGAVTALTSSGASIAVDLALTNNYSHTLTENTTLAAPTNATAGQSGIITFTQHASAPKTLAYNAFWKFPLGVVPTLTATNSAVDVFAYYVNSASFATCQLIKGIA